MCPSALVRKPGSTTYEYALILRDGEIIRASLSDETIVEVLVAAGIDRSQIVGILQDLKARLDLIVRRA